MMHIVVQRATTHTKTCAGLKRAFETIQRREESEQIDRAMQIMSCCFIGQTATGPGQPTPTTAFPSFWLLFSFVFALSISLHTPLLGGVIVNQTCFESRYAIKVPVLTSNASDRQPEYFLTGPASLLQRLAMQITPGRKQMETYLSHHRSSRKTEMLDLSWVGGLAGGSIHNGAVRYGIAVVGDAI